jgi:hypothetical protein
MFDDRELIWLLAFITEELRVAEETPAPAVVVQRLRGIKKKLEKMYIEATTT